MGDEGAEKLDFLGVYDDGAAEVSGGTGAEGLAVG